MRAAWTYRAFALSSFISFLGHTSNASAQEVATDTSIAIQAQIEQLQKKLEAAKVREAEQAIAAEDAAVRKAAQARSYLASIGRNPPPAAAAADDQAAAVAAAAAAADSKDVKATVTRKPDGTVETKVEPQRALAEADNNKQTFGGIEFGIGIAFSYDLGDNDRVRSASVVDGLVRVDHMDNVRARLILESHYLFTPTDVLGITNIFGLSNATEIKNTAGKTAYVPKDRKEWGIGPFVALQPGTDNVIDAIGAGLMLGFRRSAVAGSTNNAGDSFNIGIGILYDIDSRVLGDGIFANKPLPGNEKDIRYMTREQSGLLIMTSYSF